MKDKKYLINGLISGFLVLISSSITAYATSYLYNSGDVSYDNTNTGLKSNNVQGAMEELYEQATDYSELKSYFKNNPTSYFNGNGLLLGQSGTTHGWMDIYYNGINTGNLYANTNGITIRANSSAGNIGQGALALTGNPVTINGKDVKATTLDQVALPSGTDSISYWENLSPGVYWYANTGAVANLPTSWGFLFKMGSKGMGDFNVLYFAQSSGAIYRKSGNSSTMTGWVQVSK